MMAWPPAPQQGEVVIRYCTKCNWMLRSAWLAQELLTTFGAGTSDAGEVASVALVPDASGGVFTVHVNGKLIWDRTVDEPSFPDAKQLKQRMRDELCPERSLGHSDVKREEAPGASPP
ncbi:Rdx family-domain-containing protein [Pavlovales sp. CCMP2436]|nr:Rdx family-domain-containing protein [Pavlovales sp. CCMP2436]